jgi:hypothetical protein
MTDILEIFPAFGHHMITGWLKTAGYHVPRDRVAASFLNVHGSSGAFGDCSIHWKVYRVAGANSLWHHDGQHGKSLCAFSHHSCLLTPLRAYTLQDCNTLLH